MTFDLTLAFKVTIARILIQITYFYAWKWNVRKFHICVGQGHVMFAVKVKCVKCPYLNNGVSYGKTTETSDEVFCSKVHSTVKFDI